MDRYAQGHVTPAELDEQFASFGSADAVSIKTWQQPATPPAVAELAEGFERFTAAMRPVIAAYIETWRQITDALRPMVEYVEQHPEVLEEWQREREAEEQLGSCHCLCGTHADQPGICTSVATPGLEITYGGTTVAHCRPCWSAKGGQPRQPSARPVPRPVGGPDAFRCDGTGEPWTP